MLCPNWKPWFGKKKTYHVDVQMTLLFIQLALLCTYL